MSRTFSMITIGVGCRTSFCTDVPGQTECLAWLARVKLESESSECCQGESIGSELWGQE